MPWRKVTSRGRQSSEPFLAAGWTLATLFLDSRVVCSSNVTFSRKAPGRSLGLGLSADSPVFHNWRIASPHSGVLGWTHPPGAHAQTAVDQRGGLEGDICEAKCVSFATFLVIK